MKAAVIFLKSFKTYSTRGNADPSSLNSLHMVQWWHTLASPLTWTSYCRPAQAVTFYCLFFWPLLFWVFSRWHNTVQNCRKFALDITVSFKPFNLKGQKCAKNEQDSYSSASCQHIHNSIWETVELGLMKHVTLK